MAKVHQIADPIIQNKRAGVGTAKDLQDTLSALFNDKTSIRDSHLLIWMIYLHMYMPSWKRTPDGVLHLCILEHKLSSTYHFVYHLTNDLGNVAVMKALSQRGHSPRIVSMRGGNLSLPWTLTDSVG